MTRRARQRWLLAVIVGSLLPVSACSTGAAAQCEKAFAEVAMSVDGVASATWECGEQFGGGWQRGDVVVEAANEKEAIVVMEAVIRAFAASPDIEGRWSTPQEYKTRDRSIVVGARDLGFKAVPTVREVRERYGITPG